MKAADNVEEETKPEADGEIPRIVEFEDAFEAELTAIEKRREPGSGRTGGKGKTHTKHKDSAQTNSANTRDTLAGLSLSGGGIRSAAFCLGSVQALDAIPLSAGDSDNQNATLFSRMDYMSSVSGGGYTAGCISAAMANDGDRFPFPSRLKADEPLILRHIRDHSNYLFPRGGIAEKLRNLAAYLRGVLAHLPLIAGLILLAAAATLWMKPTASELDAAFLSKMPGDLFSWLTAIGEGNFLLSRWMLIVLVVAMIAWSIVRSWKSGRPGHDEIKEYYRRGTRIIAILIAILAAVFTVELQPRLIAAIWHIGASEGTTDDAWFTFETAVNLIKGTATVLGTVAAFVAALRGFLGLGEASTGTFSGPMALLAKYTRRVVYLLIGLVLPLGLWLIYLYLSYWGMADSVGGYGHSPGWMQTLTSFVSRAIGGAGAAYAPASAYFLSAVGLLGLSLALRANANSPHNLYRDRLSDAFIVAANGNGADDDDDDVRPVNYNLHQIGGGNAPFHLINSALNIQGSKAANKRGRNASFFTFSKLHCGSEETGYLDSRDLPKIDPGFTLASAVAVSAAAASTAMGSLSMKPLALTLAVLNVRLGYWFRNPRDLSIPHVGEGQRKYFSAVPWLRQTPYDYLAREISNSLDEKSPLVYLSDGGHIENLGLYSLLKRRCRFVVVVDAEADPEMSFGALVKVQRYARIDLGIRINIRFDEIQKASRTVRDRLNAQGRKKPGGKTGETTPSADDEKLDTELPHCALGIIEYPEEAGLDGGSPTQWRNRGLLLYVKSSLSGDENDYVRDYARVNRAFPHETTGDQFFSEEQFEVYRALGFHVVHGALTGNAPVQMNKTVGMLPRELCGEHGPIDNLLERLDNLFKE
ncbi:MAG: hypothetical protein AB3N20_02360 [Rhizobiaceae bacterium]